MCSEILSQFLSDHDVYHKVTLKACINKPCAEDEEDLEMVYTIHNYWTVFDYRNQLKAGDIINYEYTGHKWTEIGFKSGWKEWYITEGKG